MFDSLRSLELLTEAIENSGADIAPGYAEYMPLTFGIANSCGEEGRPFFHRICRISPKYSQKDAERIYTNALRKGNGSSTLGTAFHLATMAGVDTQSVFARLREEEAEMRKCKNAKMQKMQAPFLHSDGQDDESDSAPVSQSAPQGEEEQMFDDPDPSSPLPTFGDYSWPAPLYDVVSAGRTESQRDALLISMMTVLGATLGKSVRAVYGDRYQYPSLQTFVVAPSASGKGVVSFTRLFADPVHDAIRAQVDIEMKEYRQLCEQHKSAGHDAQTPPPQPPVNRLFLIPGNNTGTGILQNIIDSQGEGLIFEIEADTVSTAIGGDYGHWSDTLRKAFDHDRLSYNRRTDREYRELKEVRLGVVICGTPAQVKPLVPSSENGLFSRQVFYYMSPERHWQNQWKRSGTKEIRALFEELGVRWKETLDRVRAMGIFTLCLTDDQQERFNEVFSSLYTRTQALTKDEMNSTVVRLAINIVRMMEVVAVLRAVEPGGESLFRPDSADISPVIEGLPHLWTLSIDEDDFLAVMGMVEVLYRHSTHIVSFLPRAATQRRANSEREELFANLGKEFTRDELKERAEALGLNVNTALSWLQRMIKRGLVTPAEERGRYRKA